RYPRFVVISFSILIIFLTIGAGKLKTLLALEDVVDPSFVSKQQLNYLLKEFKVHNSMILALKKPAEGWSDQSLCAINHWLTQQRVENTNLLGSISAADIRKGRLTTEYVLYPRILHLSCLEDDGRLSDSSQIADELKELQKSPWGFSLIGVNSEDWLIQFDLKDASEGTRYGTFDPTVVEHLQKSFSDEVSAGRISVQYSWIGTADFQYYLYVGLKRVNILNLALLILLILMFRWMYGTWKAGLVYCGSIIVTGVMCYGLMGWASVPIDILSKSLFLMIAVAALEDFVYLLAKTYELNGNWKKAWRQILLPGFLTSLTTAIGFISLCTSNLQIIRRFGFWASVSSMLEWAVIFFLCPAIFVVFPRMGRLTLAGRKRGYDFFNKIKLFGIPRRLSYLLLVIFLFVPTAFRNLNVKDVPLDMFSSDHPFKKGILDVKQRNGWEAQVSLVFGADMEEGKILNVIERVKALPAVVHVMGAQAMEDYFSKDAPNSFIKKLVLSELQSAPFMENWVGRHGDRRYNLFLREGDTEAIHDLELRVGELCKSDCYLAGVPVVYSEFSRKVPETLLSSFSLSIILVSIVLVWLCYCCQNFSNVPWILLSSFWGPGLMFLLISALSIKVNFLTCVFASVLVGLTGDNAIQFLCAGRKQTLQNGILKGGGASLVSGFLMALSSLIFLGSYFIPPRTFGLLLMGGFVASTMGDYWLLQALTRKKNATHK
ncbi:MAG TPA: hypothetical protein VN132_00845, partial [Bdellovibrio sp.]|nr:hypothetical protein [Bdellovibrio sp.]